jgi:ATP-dependent Clp protease ATP-binding subunit ClpC
VRVNDGVATRILLDFDADAEIRNEIIRMLSGAGGRREKIGAAELPEYEFEAYEPPTRRSRPEFGTELARLRAEKLAAIAAQEFERAALLSDRERRLTSRARALEQVWREGEASGQPEPD